MLTIDNSGKRWRSWWFRIPSSDLGGMMKHCIFLDKNSRVVNVADFDSEDQELAQRITEEQGHEVFQFSDDNVQLYSIWDGTKYNPPTEEFIAKFNETGRTDWNL